MIARATGRTIVWRRRADNMLRFVAAVPIGYLVASLWAIALSRILPLARIDAVVTGTLAAFVIIAGAAMYAYAARSGWRAFATLLLLAGVAAAIAEAAGRP